jgi:hypothetical protein
MALCEALTTAAGVQDRSASLLSTLTAALLSSFAPSEAISSATKKSCSKALLVISSISREGYIEGLSEVSQSISDLISLFTVVGTGALDRQSNITSVYPVSDAVSLTVITCIIFCVKFLILPLTAFGVLESGQYLSSIV